MTPESHYQILFKAHVAKLQSNADVFLNDHQLSGVVFAAGTPLMMFEDDMPYSFVTNHYFRYWCPAKGPNHALVIRPSKKPLLLAHEPADFWHAVEKVGYGTYWAKEFEIKTFSEKAEIWEYIEAHFKGFAMHGEVSFKPEAIKLVEIPARLLANFNWARAQKTDYEIACLEEATKIGARGHIAAREAFLRGETEFGIHLEFLKGMELGEDELPYTPIIGLNANAAILHYHWKNKSIRNGSVLLIDAGAQFNNYASDITRTHVNEKANSVFTSLLLEMEAAQQRLCALIKPGLNNRDLNHHSRLEVAKILLGHQILTNLSAEAVVAENLVYDFYPHGIGHPLGLHVHDVGGFQADKDGGVLERTDLDGSLRSFRTFEPRNYQTVEPGLYFIEMLLERRKQTRFTQHYNWKLIESLKPSGGIRIEDNVLVTETGHRNLTREFLGTLKIAP